MNLTHLLILKYKYLQVHGVELHHVILDPQVFPKNKRRTI
jgi:hypothetical protein